MRSHTARAERQEALKRLQAAAELLRWFPQRTPAVGESANVRAVDEEAANELREGPRHMIVAIYANGDLEVPRRAEAEGVLGDGTERIGPEHPDYEAWVDAVERELVDVSEIG